MISTFQNPVSPGNRSPAHQSGYDTFPRRSSSGTPQHQLHPAGGQTILTEALVHQNGFHLPSSAGSRPTVSVKPRPVAKIVAKTKRNSREYGYFCGSEENLEKLKWSAQNSYANMEIGNAYRLDYETSKEVMIDCSAPGGGLLSPRLQLNRLAHSPRKVAPPVPPKRTPAEFPLPPMILKDDPSQFSECNGISPAPSMDDLPPPPAPPSITCEEQIRNLRSIMTNSIEGRSAAADNLCRSDSASCSSSECLPFANENVGTIRSKSQALNGQLENPTNEQSPSRRTNVKDLFPPPPSNLNTQVDPELKVGQPVQVAR